MNAIDPTSLDWKKMDGLIPTIIQNAQTGKVLMLGYMNQEALLATLSTGQLIMYSRSRKKLWRKGETSGNSMTVHNLSHDCDMDSLLIQVLPKGPACHLGYLSCYQPTSHFDLGFLAELIALINQRAEEQRKDSYTWSLMESGINRCAQKVGEEAIETVLAAAKGDSDELINESADLLFHLLVLLKMSSVNFYDILSCLQERNKDV